jgi:hypothetical protein
MLNAVCHQLVYVHGLTTGVGRVSRRLVPGAAEMSRAIPVNVHIRAYDEALPPVPRVLGPESGYGRLPVGSILDCYA